MAGFTFELVSPERVLFSGNVASVVVPSADGEMTVLPNHAPFMSAVRPGVVTVDGGKRIFVRGGFVDISSTGLTLLAEQAIAVDDINVETLSADIRNTEEDVRDAKTDEARARASAHLDGLKAMMAAVQN